MMTDVLCGVDTWMDRRPQWVQNTIVFVVVISMALLVLGLLVGVPFYLLSSTASAPPISVVDKEVGVVLDISHAEYTLREDATTVKTASGVFLIAGLQQALLIGTPVSLRTATFKSGDVSQKLCERGTDNCLRLKR